MPPETTQAVSVFQYLNAKEFLSQAYNVEKHRNPMFSHRYIAKAMGAKSSSFFKDVLNGRIKLTPGRMRSFARIFKLAKRETEHFENLMLYAQADTEDEKKHYLQRLLARSTLHRHTVLEAFQMEYFKKWYYAAVRELVGLIDFQGDYKRLAGMLEPSITSNEAMEAVQLLLKLKLIRKTAQGRLEKVDKVVSSGTTNNPGLVKPAIRENLDLAYRALEEYPVKIRPFSYLTLSISEESFLRIHVTLKSFRKEILDIAAHDEGADRLYQLNFQLFPLSKVSEQEKK